MLMVWGRQWDMLSTAMAMIAINSNDKHLTVKRSNKHHSRPSWNKSIWCLILLWVKDQSTKGVICLSVCSSIHCSCYGWLSNRDMNSMIAMKSSICSGHGVFQLFSLKMDPHETNKGRRAAASAMRRASIWRCCCYCCCCCCCCCCCSFCCW